jgi:hypothetical protein
MQTVPVIIEADGILRLAPGVSLPAGAHLAVIALKPGEMPDEISSEEIARFAEAGGAFDFLKDEPDLYSIDDIKPENRNPNYRRNASGL